MSNYIHDGKTDVFEDTFKPTKILILDDEPIRHDTLKFRYGTRCVYTHAFSVASALYALQHNDFDSITLDHDLGLYRYLSPEDDDYEMFAPIGATDLILVEQNGLVLARKMITHVDWSGRKRPHVIIHSHNPVGARAMHDILRGDGFYVTISEF